MKKPLHDDLPENGLVILTGVRPGVGLTELALHHAAALKAAGKTVVFCDVDGGLPPARIERHGLDLQDIAFPYMMNRVASLVAARESLPPEDACVFIVDSVNCMGLNTAAPAGPLQDEDVLAGLADLGDIPNTLVIATLRLRPPWNGVDVESIVLGEGLPVRHTAHFHLSRSTRHGEVAVTSNREFSIYKFPTGGN